MKIIGLLGGMSDKATAEYYRRLNAAVNRELGGWTTPEVVISSVNFARIERFVREGNWVDAGHYLAAKAEALQRAGVELVACVSNTMHRVVDAFTAPLSIPFLHIADPTGRAIRASRLQKVGLIGTLPVMSDDSLRRYYRTHFGLDVIVPPPHEQIDIDRIIFDELVRGEINAISRDALLAAIDGLVRAGAEGVILGCTEFSLIVEQAHRPDLPVFDTTELHVEALARYAVDGGRTER